MLVNWVIHLHLLRRIANSCLIDVLFSSSSFSFWVDFWENDTVFWVNDVNCRFWVDRRTVIFSFSSNSSRSTALWKEKIDDDDDILLRDVIFRSNLLTSLTSWISMLERIFNSCQKHDFQHSLVSELSANRTSARLIDSEQIARSFVSVILIEYVNQCKSSDHDLSSS
jgi:hypothetical protein